MSAPDVNAARQVLMNELGLTRASVREMVEDIVKETVDRHVDKLIGGGFIEKHVMQATKEALKQHRWDNVALSRIIADSVADVTRKHVLDHLKL